MNSRGVGTTSVVRAVGIVAVPLALTLLSACSSNASVSPSPSSPPSSSPTPLPSVSTSAAPSAAPTPSPQVPSLTVVGLGDSYMTSQNSKGESFLTLYAEGLKAASGKNVDVVSLARDDGTTANVRENLASNDSFKETIAKADVIVISVGANDADPFGVYPKGTCSPKATLKACLKAYAPTFAGNYEQILESVTSLRGGKPTAVRVLSSDNPFVGWAEAPTPTFGTDFYRQVAEAETAAACAAAKRHSAVCVDFLRIFNGKDGSADTAKYLQADHNHPGDLGIQVIADELVKAGTPELP